ncbi:Rieske 2Fe-2S domain-containing protein [Waterburya agarophytonicola K14]|uniref:Rieske 2Fe-2S domain-containing protein n=1 Tax=Waterburya agarophytonicola KI4 TaxID=2874699 RepID=A0A964BYJ4_9CYAN|nr:Rieske 2Fe-2S domain-containing protein [Waterburya agarophytonicola]MCC0179416.1 Rieske 2Fe-2S domain-containing protein [Waterburya agarophytonicola KI4]
MTTTSDSPKTATLLPGGEDSTVFNPLEAWYPIYYVEDLDPQKLSRFTLLNTDLVIWWDKKENNWQVFKDKCPHRLAPLSEGRINETGLLECPYHGWAFSGNGQCEVIPQQQPDGEAHTSTRACVRSYPTAIAQGLLFVYPGMEENGDKTAVPIIEPMSEDPDAWVCLNIFRDLPYDALTLLENVIDASHIPYTHHKTVGNRSNVAPLGLEVVESNKQGFKGIWEEGPRKGKLGTQYTTFSAPCLMWHDLTSKQFGRTLTVVYATPISKGKCRLFARFPFKFSSPFPRFFIKLAPQWYNHTNQNGVLEDDQIFLHHQERYLEALGGGEKYSQAFYLPTKADLYVSELRQWVNLYRADPFPDRHLPPALSKEQLLDRYHSHTKNCASCSQALRNIQKIKIIAIALAILTWAIIPLLSLFISISPRIIAIALPSTLLVSSITWWQLHKLERKFYQGVETPPRNQ